MHGESVFLFSWWDMHGHSRNYVRCWCWKPHKVFHLGIVCSSCHVWCLVSLFFGLEALYSSAFWLTSNWTGSVERINSLSVFQQRNEFSASTTTWTYLEEKFFQVHKVFSSLCRHHIREIFTFMIFVFYVKRLFSHEKVSSFVWH